MISLSPDPFSRKKITSVTFGNLYTYVCVSVSAVYSSVVVFPHFFLFFIYDIVSYPLTVKEKFENKTI
jgi:hypothetical protein